MLDKFEQPSIEILNIRIDEPITTLTDLLLAAICFYAYYRINKQDYTCRGKGYFKYYFLVLGLGAITGGLLGHAFLYGLAEQWKLVSWILTLLAVGLISQAMLEVARPYINKAFCRLISWCNVLLFAIVLFFTLWTIDFSLVKYYSIFGMVVIVGSLCFYIYLKTSNRGTLFILGGVGLGCISAVIFSFEWGLSPWFNHNDISHMILSFTVYQIYKGAVLIMASVLSTIR